MIEIKHLKIDFNGNVPLTDINMTVNDGDVISVIGPSGTGKSTLLRCMNLLEKPTSGEILLDGKNILNGGIKAEDLRKKVGMVFQGFYLYPHLNVIENIMIPQMHILKRSKQEAYDKAVELLKQVGVFEKAKAYPDTLSGGQKQRVAIARTLALDTDIILFDEPTSALDPTMVGEVEYVIGQLAKTGKTMIIVTHEMRFAKNISNRVLFMCDGIICEEGTPEQIFENPQNEKTAEFVNKICKEEIVISSRFFDFPEAVRKIEMFAEKSHLSREKTNTLQLLFEETVMQLIIPNSNDNVDIKATLHFSEKTEETELNILFRGDNLSFDKDSNTKSDLSMKLITAKAKSFTEGKTENSNKYNRYFNIIF